MSSDKSNEALDRQFALRRAGLRQVDVARALRVSASMVSQVLRGVRTSRRIQAYVGRRVGRTPEELWPR